VLGAMELAGANAEEGTALLWLVWVVALCSQEEGGVLVFIVTVLLSFWYLLVRVLAEGGGLPSKK